MGAWPRRRDGNCEKFHQHARPGSARITAAGSGGGGPLASAGKSCDSSAVPPRVSSVSTAGSMSRSNGTNASENTAYGTPVSTGCARPVASGEAALRRDRAQRGGEMSLADAAFADDERGVSPARVGIGEADYQRRELRGASRRAVGVLSACRLRRDPAEPTLAHLEVIQRAEELLLGELGPHHAREVELRVGALPEQEVAETLFAAAPDQQIDVGNGVGIVVDLGQQPGERVAGRPRRRRARRRA